jgi:RNA polymerase sigma-70 factor, ECF subfamily
MHELLAIADEEIVSQGATDDLAREFEERLPELSTLAFRVAYGVLRHRQDAEDVAQETLVRSHQKLNLLRDRERFLSWLIRICWRMALDHRRSQLRRLRREFHAVAEAPLTNVEDAAANNESRERLWREIDALPEKLRVTLLLSGIDGYGVREVAARLDLPEGTVKSRLYLARKLLAEKMR